MSMEAGKPLVSHASPVNLEQGTILICLKETPSSRQDVIRLAQAPLLWPAWTHAPFILLACVLSFLVNRVWCMLNVSFRLQHAAADVKAEFTNALVEQDAVNSYSTQNGDYVTPIHTPTVKHRLLLDLALTLFQLPFSKTVGITDDDKELGFNDELRYEASLHTALNRELET